MNAVGDDAVDGTTRSLAHTPTPVRTRDSNQIRNARLIGKDAGWRRIRRGHVAFGDLLQPRPIDAEPFRDLFHRGRFMIEYSQEQVHVADRRRPVGQRHLLRVAHVVPVGPRERLIRRQSRS